jgi:hypothetical protein
MIDVNHFVFDQQADLPLDTRIVEVPSTTSTEDQLLSVFDRSLELPDYFGWNWDALENCLRDLSWLKAHTVLIRHDGVPKLPSDILGIYLDILSEIVLFWRKFPEHEVVVSFPASARNDILGLVGGDV